MVAAEMLHSGSALSPTLPFVMALHFAVNTVPHREEVTLLYLLRDSPQGQAVHLSSPSAQGERLGSYEAGSTAFRTVDL